MGVCHESLADIVRIRGKENSFVWRRCCWVQTCGQGSKQLPMCQLNKLAIEYEASLKQMVEEFNATIPDLHLVLAHGYDIEYDMITNPQSFGMCILMDYHVD